MNSDKIETEALKLDPKSRARLAGKLLESLENLSDDEYQALWGAEAERRNTELENGVAEARPADDVFRNANRRIK